jgi:hypothetical protein
MLHLAAYNLSRAIALAQAYGGLAGRVLAAVPRRLAIRRIHLWAPLTRLRCVLTALPAPTPRAAHV